MPPFSSPCLPIFYKILLSHSHTPHIFHNFSLYFGWAFFRDFKRSGKILFLSILIQSKAQQSTNVVSVLTVSRSVYITIYSISPYSEIIPYLPTMLLMTARRYANPEFPVHHTTSRSECCPTQPEGQVARSELWIGSS